MLSLYGIDPCLSVDAPAVQGIYGHVSFCSSPTVPPKNNMNGDAGAGKIRGTFGDLATENKLGTDKARRELSRGSRAWARWLLVEGSGCAEGQRLSQPGLGFRRSGRRALSIGLERAR